MRLGTLEVFPDGEELQVEGSGQCCLLKKSQKKLIRNGLQPKNAKKICIVKPKHEPCCEQHFFILRSPLSGVSSYVGERSIGHHKHSFQ